MFLGYQKEKVVMTANTKEELETMPCIEFDKIEESLEDWQLVNGEYRVGGKTEAELAEEVRADRDRLLKESDVRMLPDFPITSEEEELWLLYRQYLRDITKAPTFPNVDVLNFKNWLEQIHSQEPVVGGN